MLLLTFAKIARDWVGCQNPLGFRRVVADFLELDTKNLPSQSYYGWWIWQKITTRLCNSSCVNFEVSGETFFS
ncbi:MAG: hypothetical protein Ct9H90mP25_1340 [Gammaproteobacteria bacterium]|nr:MAG: hypothetical protein Ct9H90mP25_1340 [Gammaproteobacteria bacterium]